MKKMLTWTKHILLIAAGLSGLFGLLLWMQGAFTPNRVEPGLLPLNEELPRTVQTVKAEYRVMDQTADAVGSIQSRNTTNVASKILAGVLAVKVRPGDAVQKGDLLIALDDRDLRARMQQAKNGLEAARATHEKTLLDRGRYESLLKSKSVTQNAYDDAASAERIAQAKLEQAQEQVREAEVMLSYAQIYAPMNGTVTEKFIDPGDTVSPGLPLLSLYDPGSLRLEVAVRERLTGRVKMKQQVPVVIDALNKQLTGTVEEIMPSADPASRSVLMKVAIPIEEGLYPGMFGRIQIPLESVRYLVIPGRAVRQVGQLEMVTLQKDNRLETRAVRTGRTWDGDVEVLSGLSEGEDVVMPDGEGERS